jgi:hypothetical protein
MAKKKEKPTVLINSRGNAIPIENVRKDHVKKHLLVEDVFDRALDLETRIKKVKVSMRKKIDKYLRQLAKKNKVENPEFEDVFEDVILTNYPGTLQIQVKNSSIIDFDENLSLAKTKIDSCFERWGKNTHQNIKIIVDKFFRVGKKGFINKNAILSLFQFRIDDAEWNEAMELIKNSIHETSKKEYTMLRYRDDNKSKWKNLNLNFSSVEVE